LNPGLNAADSDVYDGQAVTTIEMDLLGAERTGRGQKKKEEEAAQIKARPIA
jgi:hypothetical protein